MGGNIRYSGRMLGMKITYPDFDISRVSLWPTEIYTVPVTDLRDCQR
jgi:hypothetical protein